MLAKQIGRARGAGGVDAVCKLNVSARALSWLLLYVGRGEVAICDPALARRLFRRRGRLGLLADAASRREAHEAAQLLLPRRAVVLAGTSPDRLVYSGAPRVIELLVDLDPDKLPWRELVLP